MKTDNNDRKGEINMNNEIKIFSNEEFGNVRVSTDKMGEPIFCLKDICEILDLKQASKVKERLSEKGVHSIPTLTQGGKQNLLYINESNLYRAIFQSRKPNAERFQDWVTDEVLPSIRKYGGYLTPQKIEEVLFNPDTIIQLATNLKNEQEKNRKLQEENIILIEKNEQQEILIDELQEENQEMKPKSLYCDKALQSDGLITITQIAKDYGYSGKEFNKILHNFKIQYKQGNTWLLYAKYQDKGYTYSKTYINEDINKSFINTQWTQKGRLFLYEFLKECGILPLIEREENEDNN